MEGNLMVKEEQMVIDRIKEEIRKVIIGQEYMIDRILIALFTDGHILLEGLPGLAKSLTASTVASVVDLDFKRIQFTPDLLPADIVGTEIYNQQTGEFVTKKGPIFSNLILAMKLTGLRQGPVRPAGGHAGKAGNHW